MKKINMSKETRILVLFSMMILLVGGSAFGLNQVKAQSDPLLWINPPSSQTGIDTSVDLQLDSITDVYGIQVELSFDPSILEVVDADTGKTGTQITTGNCPAPDFPVENAADNTAGTIGYAVAQMNPTLPCDGGTVATVEFRCLPGVEGTSPVSIDFSLISDINAQAIVHTPQNGTVECLSSFTIQGEVVLQLWDSPLPNYDPSGITVQLIDEGTNTVESEVQVSPDNTFSFVAHIDNTYSVEASHDRHLDRKKTGISSTTIGEVVDLGTTTLRAGDLNNDGVINITDIVMVAGNYNKVSPIDW